MWGNYFDRTPEVGHNIGVLLVLLFNVAFLSISLFYGERLRLYIANYL